MESWWIDRKRLLVESVDRLRAERVLDRFWDAVGRRRDDVEVGKGGAAIVGSHLLLDVLVDA